MRRLWPDDKNSKECSSLGCVAFRVADDFEKGSLPALLVFCDEGEHRLMAFVEFL